MMLKNARYFIYSGMICLSFFSCHRKIDEVNEIIPPAKMQPLIWDIFRAHIYAKEIISRDTIYNDSLDFIAMKKVIFTKHKISEQQYNRSYDYYLNHPELLSKMIDSMINQQKKNQKILLKEFHPE